MGLLAQRPSKAGLTCLHASHILSLLFLSVKLQKAKVCKNEGSATMAEVSYKISPRLTSGYSCKARGLQLVA